MRGLCDLSSDAPSDLFKDRPVLIQTQSSVMMENHRIQQIDVWSQAFVGPKLIIKRPKIDSSKRQSTIAEQISKRFL
jgi:hypothetical protein